MSDEQYPKAMHGPEGAYKVVDDEKEEKKLRKAGWIDGNEHFAQPKEAENGAE